MLSTLRRIYIISKRRALSGRDVEIRALPDTELLFINYMYTNAGEIRDFESWAAIIVKILPELDEPFVEKKSDVPVPESAPEPKVDIKPRTGEANTVAVKPSKLLDKIAIGVKAIIPSVEVEATPKQIKEFFEGTKN